MTFRGRPTQCPSTRSGLGGSAFPSLLLSTAVLILSANAPAQQASPDIEMHRHYDAAYRLQQAGDMEGADGEHRLFIAEALHRVANARANIGEYSQAEPLYEDALQFTADDADLRFDYAKAAMDAEDPQKALRLTTDAIGGSDSMSLARKTWLIRIEAESLRNLGQHEKSIELFKSAVVLDPSFDSLYALANAYLWVGDKADGGKTFGEMKAKFADNAVLHMDLGRGYAEANYFPEAIAEYRRAIAMDSRLRGVHYSLGACYVSLMGANGYALAEAEFRKELTLQPNDPFSYPQLGKIALARHDNGAAEADLKRAVALNPNNPDNYLLLADLYTETEKVSDAIAALRKAIALTTDPSRNHYSIHAAHYQLGRLLIQTGNPVEGKEEMKVAEDLLSRNDQEDKNLLDSKPQVQLPLETTRIPSAGEVAEDRAYESSIAPLIARSYNNLGVHAAISNNYAAAASWFRHAAEWDPSLTSATDNWGRAAFAAHQYAEAVAPLEKALRAHPGDRETRIELGVSEYQAGSYVAARDTLSPIASSFISDPSLASLYANCKEKSGDSRSNEPQTVPTNATKNN